ncbi:MAG: TatD family deoxyribonuclease [Piscirickettsiaceae bacterium]|nr:MAG: TatD family deoxyribonuclease [Piscirickettsiaceae bacterium]
MFIDSHCHLDRVDLTPYENDLDNYMEATKIDLLDHMLCVSINWEDYPAMRDLVAKQSKVSISVGVHPNEIDGHDPSLDELVSVAERDGAIAIGETGLDYFRLETGAGVEYQQQRFRTHIHAAKQTNKPIIVHTRDAKEDTLRIIEEEGAGEAGGVLHCFTEDWDMAKRALDNNFYISLSGIVTFKNAQQIHDVAKKVPDDRLLIETDSPYLAPVPKRGKPNYPNYVKYVAERVAELRGVNVSKIADITSNNYQKLFVR